MVDREEWGKLKQRLVEYTSEGLSELCYVLDLHWSGLKAEKIQRILSSEYDREYVENRLNFLDFGLALMDYFSHSELTDIIYEYDLPRPPRKWDRMIEIVKSEQVTPRTLLGQLTTDKLGELYYDVSEDDSTLDREALIRGTISTFGLEWLEEIMDSGFIMMAMGADGDLERAYQVIKDECERFDINAVRIDEVASSGVINDEVLEMIKASEYLFVDLTYERPNVYYELGYCHGLDTSPERIILMAKKGTRLHFDIRNMRTIFYKGHDQLRRRLRKRLKAMKKK